MGYFFVLLFVVMGSIQDVYLGSLFQSKSPLVVAFFSFILATLLFWFWLGKSLVRTGARVLNQRRDFLNLNLMTAANWLCFFLALRYVEPAVVGAVAFASVPAFSTLLTPLLRPQQKVLSRQYISAVGVTFGLTLLVLATFTHSSSMKETSPLSALIGISLSLVAAAGMTLNTFISKNLSEKGFKAVEILAYRFGGLILIAGILLIVLEPSSVLGPFSIKIDWLFSLQMVLIALGVVVLPLYLVQKGIELVEPITVAILISLTPVTTYLFEALDTRLRLSPLTFAGVLTCAFFSMGGIIYPQTRK